mgnify:CR=1 FL=1
MSFQIDIEYLEEAKNLAPTFSNVLRKSAINMICYLYNT